jgi:hypothetical protein
MLGIGLGESVQGGKYHQESKPTRKRGNNRPANAHISLIFDPLFINVFLPIVISLFQKKSRANPDKRAKSWRNKPERATQSHPQEDQSISNEQQHLPRT